MPIRRGPLTFARFRVAASLPKDTRRWLTKGLDRRSFEPIDPKGDEDRSSGFVSFERPDTAEFPPSELFRETCALFAWRIEKLRLPAQLVRTKLAEWAKAFEQEHRRKPGRSEKAEYKESLRRSLRTQVEPSVRVFDVSFDLRASEIQIWATSRVVVDEVVEALEESLDLRLVPCVPASFLDAEALDRLVPTTEFFGDELSQGGN